MSFQENKEETNQKVNVESEENSSSPSQDAEKNIHSRSPHSGINEEFSEFNDSASNVSAQSQESDNFPVPPQSDQDKISSLETEIVSVNAKLVETHNKMLRIAADADNTRKRLEKEKMETRLYSIQEFARDLLPVIDAFEKALQILNESNENEDSKVPTESNTKLASVTEGVKLVSKIFQDVTKKNGIERLPGKGSPFNPMYHNAIAKETGTDYKTEIVIEEFMSGYKIGDRILRTALVKVGAPD